MATCTTSGCFCSCRDCGKGNHSKHSNHGTGCHMACTPPVRGGSEKGSKGRRPGAHRATGRGSRGGPRCTKACAPIICDECKKCIAHEGHGFGCHAGGL